MSGNSFGQRNNSTSDLFSQAKISPRTNLSSRRDTMTKVPAKTGGTKAATARVELAGNKPIVKEKRSTLGVRKTASTMHNKSQVQSDDETPFGKCEDEFEDLKKKSGPVVPLKTPTGFRQMTFMGVDSKLASSRRSIGGGLRPN